MNNQKKSDGTHRIPASTRSHQQQTMNQIWLPLVLFILLVLAIAVLASFGTASNSLNGLHWANISLIFMIIPTMVAGLMYLAILGGLAYGVIKLRNSLPIYAYQAQAFLYRAAVAIRNWADSTTRPVMTVKGWSARWKTIQSILSGKSQHNVSEEKDR
jgi:uncharacterized integral membrane protein